MDIRFVSSLTPEDETQLAVQLMKLVTGLLDDLPLAYAIRIETVGAKVLQHSHLGTRDPVPVPLSGPRAVV